MAPPVARALALLALASVPASAQSRGTCVDVRVGNERSYACLNDALAKAARQVHGDPDLGTLSVTSPPQALGGFDRAATAERLGDAFGHSVIAQRPPPPVYVSPLLAGPRASTPGR
jgi:hypothetical protein